MDSKPLGLRSVVCVLKVGKWHNGHIRTEYKPKTVQWLKAQVDTFAPEGTRFVCFSDVEVDGVEVIPLQHNWPGWWSKIEMFQHDLGPVFYMDLDTVLVGRLDELLAYPHKFTAIGTPANRKLRLGSGLMAWTGARPDLYEPFAKDPDHWIATCNTGECWGDQGFIQKHIDSWQSFEQILPGKVGSFKNTFGRKKPPNTASICYFHGAPKPHEVDQAWIPRGYL